MQIFHLFITFGQILFHSIFIWVVKIRAFWLPSIDEKWSRFGSEPIYNPNVIRIMFTYISPIWFFIAMASRRINVFLFTGLDIMWFFLTLPFEWASGLIISRLFGTFILYFLGTYMSYIDFIEGSITTFFKSLRRTGLNQGIRAQNANLARENQMKINRINALLQKNIEELQKEKMNMNEEDILKTTNDIVGLINNLNFPGHH